MSFICMRVKFISISKAEHLTSFWYRGPGGTRKWPLYLDVFNSESTRREKLFPPLSATHVLALDKTHLNKHALSAKTLCVQFHGYCQSWFSSSSQLRNHSFNSLRYLMNKWMVLDSCRLNFLVLTLPLWFVYYVLYFVSHFVS